MRHTGRVLWFVTMAAIGAWFGVMALDSEPPFTYLSEAEGSYISPNPVAAGGAIATHWQLTHVVRDCPRQVERIYSDLDTGEVVTSMDATPLMATVKKNRTTLSRAFNLPPELPPHTGYQARTCFQCNILQMFFPMCIMSPVLSINVLPATK